ncbi:MAG TPA: hypothetical protein VII59_07330 [Streptosporangiaceae bacterium]
MSSSAMREPSGVVYQDRAPGSVALSVDLSAISGRTIPCTASRRAVLSSSRQALTLIPSMVPPVLNATSHTGPRAASQARSWARMAALADGDAAA